MAAGDKLCGPMADFINDVSLKYDERDDQATLFSCVACGADNIPLFEYVELRGHCVTCFCAGERRREELARTMNMPDTGVRLRGKPVPGREVDQVLHEFGDQVVRCGD